MRLTRKLTPVRAFTVLELVATLVIVSVLSGIGYVGYTQFIATSQDHVDLASVTSATREAQGVGAIDATADLAEGATEDSPVPTKAEWVDSLSSVGLTLDASNDSDPDVTSPHHFAVSGSQSVTDIEGEVTGLYRLSAVRTTNHRCILSMIDSEGTQMSYLAATVQGPADECRYSTWDDAAEQDHRNVNGIDDGLGGDGNVDTSGGEDGGEEGGGEEGGIDAPDAPVPTASVGNASATISWNEPTSDDAPINTYGYEYVVNSPSGSTISDTYTLSVGTWQNGASEDVGDGRSIAIDGLTNGVSYDIDYRVFASNGAVDEFDVVIQSWSAWGNATLVPASVPGIPENGTGSYDPLGGSITISWTAPVDDGGGIDSYVVSCSTTGSGGTYITVATVTNLDLSATFSSYNGSALAPGTTFDCRVEATNPEGSGGAEDIAPITTDSAPDAPNAPNADSGDEGGYNDDNVTGNGTADLSWDAPGEGSPDSYNIEYYVTTVDHATSVALDGATQTATTTAPTTSYTVTGLSVNQYVTFRVQAESTSAGTGDWTDWTSQNSYYSWDGSLEQETVMTDPGSAAVYGTESVMTDPGSAEVTETVMTDPGSPGAWASVYAGETSIPVYGPVTSTATVLVSPAVPPTYTTETVQTGTTEQCQQNFISNFVEISPAVPATGYFAQNGPPNTPPQWIETSPGSPAVMGYVTSVTTNCWNVPVYGSVTVQTSAGSPAVYDTISVTTTEQVGSTTVPVYNSVWVDAVPPTYVTNVISPYVAPTYTNVTVLVEAEVPPTYASQATTNRVLGTATPA